MLYGRHRHGADARFGIDGNVGFFLRFDGANGATTYVDSGPKNLAVTRLGTSTISTAQSKFGGSSLLFGGGDGASIPDTSAIEPGGGNWTVDFWLYPTSIAGSTQGVFGKAPSASFGPILILHNAGNLDMYLSTTGSSWAISGALIAAVSINTWYHIALVRSGNTIYPFKDGVLGTTQSLSGTLVDNAEAWHIGGYGGSIPGHIDEVRYSFGTARWTANFTPPPMPYGL